MLAEHLGIAAVYGITSWAVGLVIWAAFRVQLEAFGRILRTALSCFASSLLRSLAGFAASIDLRGHS